MPKKNEVKHEIYKEISKDTGMSIIDIAAICDSQFGFVKEVMERGEFDTVRIAYLGKFSVNPYRVQNINNRDAVIQRRKLSGNS